MIVSLLLTVVGLGILARLVLQLAIFALPVTIGFWAGLAAWHAGAGPVGGIAVGFAAGAGLFALGIVVNETTRSPLLRIAVSAIFAAPAALAGYHLAYRLSGIGSPTEWWRVLTAFVGAVVIGSAAWARLNAPRPGGPEGAMVARDHGVAAVAQSTSGRV
jgi:hypothetical protein